MFYDPTISGAYNLSVQLLTKGGLKATFYRKTGLKDPVLVSLGNLHDGSYHNPYWCDGLQRGNFSAFWTFGPVTYCDMSLEGCGCDSTRLDSRMSFDWGTSTALPFDNPYNGQFPIDFFSVAWTGYLVAPSSGAYTLTVATDYGVSVSINGTSYVSAVPLSTASTSFTLTLQAGSLNAIDIVYTHNTERAAFTVTWSGPGIAANSVLSGENLYYSRHVVRSPVSVLVTPGAVDSKYTSAVGSGLTDCTTMTECSFVIQARDSAGNNIYNYGAQDWNISIYGIGDWAGFDRSITQVNDVNFTHVQHLAVTVVPEGWVTIGLGNVSFGNRYVTLFSNATTGLNRGDTIRVVAENMFIPYGGVFDEFTTNSDVDYTHVPLSRPYRGANSTSVMIYRVTNCTTGKYLVTYTPKVRGYYQVSLMINAVEEVQTVQLLSDGHLGGNFTLTVVSNLDGDTLSFTTVPIAVASLTSSTVSAALNALTNLNTVSVSVIQCDTTNCIFTVTFHGLDQDLPPMQVYSDKVTGNALKVVVSEVTKGSASQDMINSPYTLTVAPNTTSAAYSTAYGLGLTYGVTGVTSSFHIQSKDTYGNNKLYKQQSAGIYKVHAFIAVAGSAIFSIDKVTESFTTVAVNAVKFLHEFVDTVTAPMVGSDSSAVCRAFKPA